MTKVMTAYEARTNFGELLNLVYYQGDEVVITKNQKPMVKIIKADNDRKATGEEIWKEFRKLAKKGKQNVNLVKMLRKQRDRGYSNLYR